MTILTPPPATPIVILDTNIVLDLFLFQDPRTAALKEQLQSGQIIWSATAHMRNELERVLTYAHISAKLAFYQTPPEAILAAFDQFAQIVEAPSSKAPYTCKDPDDQVFIDLACHLVNHTPHTTPEITRKTAKVSQANRSDPAGIRVSTAKPNRSIQLISKDKAVLAMRKRLEKLTVIVNATFLV